MQRIDKKGINQQMKPFLVLISLCLLEIPAYGDVVVRIVDFPAKVPQYSPVFVTASVENTGSDPVLIPASFLSDSHYFVEIGNSEDNISEYAPHTGTGGGKSVWISPGGLWFFRVEVGRAMTKVGKYFFRVGLTSKGICRFPLQLPGDPQAIQVNENPVYPAFQCWAGSVRSEIKEVEVFEPNGPTDGAALEYIKSEDFPVKCCLENKFQIRIIAGYGRLLIRFPTSHYTFVGALYNESGDANELENLLKLQPEHPMAVYMRLGLALALIEKNREAEVTPEFIATLKLKPAHEAYLGQVLREKRLREMMKSKTPGPGK